MKKALIVSVSINIIIVCFFIGKRYYYSKGQNTHPTQPTNTVNPFFDQFNQMRSSLFKELSIDSTDIVFVGNSLTEGFPVTEIYGLHVKNRGIGGNTTGHILNRIESIASPKPRKIFIEAGINDLNLGYTVDSAFDNYRAIICTIKRITPQTRIYIQSVTPTCMDYKNLLDKIISLNDSLVKYCTTHGIDYIDLYNPLFKSSGLDSTFTADGVHLNAKGYEIWMKEINKYMK